MNTPSQRRVRVLMTLLRRGKTTTRALAEALSLPVRTVRTDLIQLQEVAPIRAIGTGRSRQWEIEGSFVVDGLGLLDRLSLELGRALTSFLEGTGLGDLSHPVRPWEGVPQHFRRNIEKKIRLLQEPAREYGPHRETIDILLDGLLRERQLSFHYQQRSHREAFTDVQPLTLVVYRRALYLLARLQDGSERRFSVDQIHDIHTGEPFQYPTTFDPDPTLRPWFGIHTGKTVETVRLRFTPRASRYVVRRRWHPTQKLEPLEDGSVLLTMTTGGVELLRFCLEWGAQVEVLSPPWLREAVADELRMAAARYEATDTTEPGPSPT